MRYTPIPNLAIFTFLLGSLGLFVVGINIDLPSQNQRGREQKKFAPSVMKNVDYFLIEEQKNTLLLKSDVLRQKSNEDLEMRKPRGIFFDRKGVKIHYEGIEGSYLKSKQIILLEGKVRVRRLKMLLRGEKGRYSVLDEEVSLKESVYSFDDRKKEIIKIWSQEAWSWPTKERLEYRGRVRGEIIRSLAYEPGIFFKANKIVVHGKLNKIELDGEVEIVRGNATAKSMKGEIFLENYSKKLKYYVLYDDVKLTEKVSTGEKSIVRKAFSEKLEGFMRDRKIILTGYPKVLQEGDVIKGGRMILYENNRVIEVLENHASFRIKE